MFVVVVDVLGRVITELVSEFLVTCCVFCMCSLSAFAKFLSSSRCLNHLVSWFCCWSAGSSWFNFKSVVTFCFRSFLLLRVLILSYCCVFVFADSSVSVFSANPSPCVVDVETIVAEFCVSECRRC